MRKKEVLQKIALFGLGGMVKAVGGTVKSALPNFSGASNTVKNIAKPIGLNLPKPGKNLFAKVRDIQNTGTNISRRVGAGIFAHGGAIGQKFMQNPVSSISSILNPA